MKRSKKLLIGAIALICILFCVCAVYVSDYYRADTAALAACSGDTSVAKHSPDDRITVYQPENPIAGLIFYPGGKVEALAYEPLMTACASRGILCVLVEMPLHLAVLDVNAAEGLPEQFPQIQDWYLGGHSLGGSMAASYLSENAGDYAGLVLLGSYSTADLSEADLEVLSIYGSEDRVLNQEKYEACRANLPEDFTEIILDGGCHAYFGVYGQQEGDGTPTITNEVQISLTAEAIAELVRN